MPWLGAAVGSGLNTGIKTGNPLAAALAAGGSYAGSALGGEFLGPTLSGLGSSTNAVSGGVTPGFLGSTVGDTFGSFAGNTLGAETLGNVAGSSLGSMAGSSIGEKAGGMLNPMNADAPGSPGFMASRSAQMGLPQSLSQFSGLDPNQQASNIATRGVYGQGNGPQENSYFTNLINRQLVDDQGQVAGDTSSINPVEGSYLSQLGLGGYNNPTDLLQKLQGYAA